MFAEEVSCAILKRISINYLCNLRYVCSQFNRIAREIIDNRYIKIDNLSISPFLGPTVYKKESAILHHFIQIRPNLKCYVALFESDGIQQFACLHFSFKNMDSSKSISFPETDDRDLTELLCLMPQLYIISFETLREPKNIKGVIEVSPQYMRIEKIHHIQTAGGIEIVVRTEINEFSNFTVPMKIFLIELDDLKNKQVLAPFVETTLTLSSIKMFETFKKYLESQAATFKYHADATRIKFNEFYDYTVIRAFTEIIELPKS